MGSNCKKCKREFIPSKGLVNYCSVGCRNSRTFSEETKLLKSVIALNSDSVKLANFNRKFVFVRDVESLKKQGDKIRATTLKKLLEVNFNDLSRDRKRTRIIIEQKGCCRNCGIDKWNEKPLTLEMEHKDGNRNNNVRENLEALCPNCHSQTSTWRGRNNKGKTSASSSTG